MAIVNLASKLARKFKPRVRTRRAKGSEDPATAVRTAKGKEAADLGTPSDVVAREHVGGERPVKGGRKKNPLDVLPSGAGEPAKKAWRAKLRKQEKWGDQLEANEKKIDDLRVQAKKATGETAHRITRQIVKLKEKNKALKEKLEYGRTSMKDMKRRRGPYIQVKKGGTVKRKSGASIGMGDALRGGGAVRRK